MNGFGQRKYNNARRPSCREHSRRLGECRPGIIEIVHEDEMLAADIARQPECARNVGMLLRARRHFLLRLGFPRLDEDRLRLGEMEQFPEAACEFADRIERARS